MLFPPVIMYLAAELIILFNLTQFPEGCVFSICEQCMFFTRTLGRKKGNLNHKSRALNNQSLTELELSYQMQIFGNAA